MTRRIPGLLVCFLALTLTAFPADSKKSAGAPPDKAELQHILDGWSPMNPADMMKYYAQGDRLFFDIAPVKYGGWTEYQDGVAKLLKGYKSLRLTMNDDAQLHREGDLFWAAATLHEDAVTAADKRELGTLRWTVIFKKMDGKWLIVHEHTSEALQ